MKTATMFTAAALLVWAVGCGGGAAEVPKAKTPESSGGEPKAAEVSAAAANKFNAGLEALVQHDKANDWTDVTCTSTAQLFLDAAKEQGKTLNEATYNAGLANQRCKKVEAAKALFKQVLDSDPKFHRAKVQMALYAFADSGEKNIDEAISTLREAAVVDAQFKNVEALVSLGMLLIKRNNKVEDQDGKSDLLRAKRFIQSAMALDDAYMPAFNQLAILYLETAKQAAGRDTKRKVASGGSKEKKVDTQALELAALVCSQGIRKNAKYASIHNTAGMIQVELGNLNGAVSEFNNARTIDPSFFEAQMNYAAVNLQFRGFQQAEQAYRKAIEIRPADYDAHLGLALALRGGTDDSNFDKNVTEASAELAKAKQLAPDRAETYYNEAILTQEYKAKSGKGGDAELLNAKKLFGDFISKAGGTGEFADAVKRSKERMSEIDQIIEFNKQSEKDRKASEADLKQKAAEAEAKGEEPAPGAAPAGEGEKKDEKKDEKKPE
jgi:tetratricopeptide (TPR) repeat protein